MKCLRLTASLTFTLCVSGCGVAYHSKRAEILKNQSVAHFGAPPPANHQAIEMAIIRERLKDPESARFQFGIVSRDAIQPAFASPNAVPVWVSSCTVNAKNSFGGYTGATPWRVAWRSGRPFAVMAYSLNQFGSEPGFWTYLQ